MRKDISKWCDQITLIKQELMELGDMRPGILTKQYNVCGTKNCKCKDPKNPKKHGPYYQLSYCHQGKSTSEFVKKDRVSTVKQELKNYKRFKKLTAKWIELSVKIAKARKKS